MLTLRYLLGLSYGLNSDGYPEDFLGADSFPEYLFKLKQYAILTMGEERYSMWNEVYGLEETFQLSLQQTPNP